MRDNMATILLRHRYDCCNPTHPHLDGQRRTAISGYGNRKIELNPRLLVDLLCLVNR